MLVSITTRVSALKMGISISFAPQPLISLILPLYSASPAHLVSLCGVVSAVWRLIRASITSGGGGGGGGARAAVKRARLDAADPLGDLAQVAS